MGIDIESLSLDQLLELNRRVVRRIEHLQALKTRAHLQRFDIGDRVSFQSEGRAVEGVVVRVNQKSISVKTSGAYWRIHPRFLTRLPSPDAELPREVRDIVGGDGRAA